MPYLLNRAGVRIGMAFSEEVSRYHVTLPMWRILAQLEHEEYRCQTELAALTSTDPATLSRLLKSMEAKGIVSRKRPKENGREVRVVMTPKGRALTKRIIPLALRYEVLAVDGIAPTQIELVKDVLTKMYDNIAAYHDLLSRQSRPANARKPRSAARTSPQPRRGTATPGRNKK